MTQTVLVTAQDGWLEIALNRPDRLNAFNEDMHIGLRDAFARAQDDGVRAVLLTGSGRGFCAGQDLSDADPDTDVDLDGMLVDYYNPLIEAIRALPKPVICAVNGVAAGAGCNMALACDILLAAEDARFIQSFAKIGLVPDAGGTFSLVRLLGPQRAKAWAMTGQPIDAATALDWGLVWAVHPTDILMAKAREFAAEMAQAATYGLGQTKHLLNDAMTGTMEDQLAAEAQVQAACGQTKDFKEGVRAFLEKRPAVFQGR